MKKLLCGGFMLLASIAFGAEEVETSPVDGTLYWGGNWSSSGLWKDGQIAADGGLMTGIFSGNTTVTLDKDGITLGGIRYPAKDLYIKGNYPLYLTGDAVVHCGSTLWGQNTYWTGNGTATVTFTGQGQRIFDQNAYLQDFKEIVLMGQRVLTYLADPFCWTDSTVRFRGASFEFTSKAAAGTDVVTSFAAGTGASVIGDWGKNRLSLDQGGAASLTVSTGPFAFAPGGSLAILVKSGKTLGTDTKVKPSVAPEMVGTLVTPALIARDMSKTTGDAYDFLTWDATKGLSVYAYDKATLAGAGADDVVTLDAAPTIAVDTQVKALRVNNCAGLTFQNNAVLTVGDGQHAAGLMLNRQGQSAVADITGAGTIDFGDAPAYVWLGGSSGGSNKRQTNFGVPIKAGATISFLSAGQSIQTEFRAVNPDLKGSVFFNCGRITYNVSGKADPFPNVTDIYLGGSLVSSAGGAQFFNVGAALSSGIKQHLHIAGNGHPGGNDLSGVLYLGLTVDGPVTLMEDTMIEPNTGVQTYNGVIDGTGTLTISDGKTRNGTVRFNASNTYVGDTIALNDRIELGADHPFGTGRVSLEPNTTLALTADSVLVTNDVTGSGALVVTAGQEADFTGDVTLGSVTLGGEGATLGVGGTVRAGTLAMGLGTVAKGLSAGSRLVLDSAEGELAGTFTGDLTVEKAGVGEVTLVGEQNHTGGTVVSEGTLKLAKVPSGIPLSGCTLWLDASDATTLDVEDGKVSEWRSKVGTVKLTNPDPKTFGTPSATGTINGRTVVTFDGDFTNRLQTSVAANVQQMFIVYRSHKLNGTLQGMVGAAAYDSYGFRLNGSTTAAGWHYNNGSFFFQKPDMPTIDGEVTASFSLNETHVMRGTRDALVSGSSWRFGSYVNLQSNGYRPWYGDIAEVVFYDRQLTETEAQVVENYLSRKWMNREIYSSAVAERVLPTGGEVRLAGGVLDLNGVSQTIGSLAGEGRIVNTADTNVTLTVTGANTFRGTVDGDITLVAMDDGSSVKAAFVNGAKLVAAGAVSAYEPPVPTDGLAYWLDAAKSETVLLDDEGCVTNWQSRVGAEHFDNVALADGARPTYQPTGMDGKPGVYFGAGDRRTRLLQKGYSTIGTLFLVLRADGTQVGQAGVWGVNANADSGLRIHEGGLQVRPPFDYGDRADLDGVEAAYNVQFLAFSSDVSHVVSVRRVSSCLSAGYASLGGYWGIDTTARYLKGWVCEVIGYTRVLSDAEYATVNDYLRAKWQVSGPLDPQYTSAKIGGTLCVPVVNGAIGTLELNGDISETALYVDGLEDLLSQRWQLLRGETVGEFLSTNLNDGWKLRYKEDGVVLGPNNGILLIVR